MARMGGQRRLKALAAPRFWPILRKEYKWAVKPRPGPHPAEKSLPLLLIVRNVLGYAQTAREARKLISEGHFRVDGVVRKDYKFPVGFMDVIEVVDTGEKFRMLPYPVKFFKLHPIPEEEGDLKPVRIENKTTVKGGHVQLNLHDGRNILVRVKDPRNPVEDVYRTMDTLLITVPGQEIKGHIKFGEGAIAIIVGGRNVGRVGVVKSVQKGWGRKRTLVTLEDASGNLFQTSLDYVFVIGLDRPVISLPEGAWK
ncbi:30S ribosomal protein S4e [Aeropyrum pernix K1]|uniref:Small ribosomal subunit protein eS4 n=1 Tax=Aeropyrum pernix (strain ATCC 700893 / DSM 11879 / JCM 9820 / NBRC 100138 / K1) TaxID=272557 RepID=RS4E_AERPE|nr:30S ribosomal protein S4e [Aeropyrum pernix]Q9YF85.2 RecName: Full=Small ribosomal subunit protein eS4; AltName: Full=30S ribosomal protein S4e [Aeropyrum pernix K1]BAA79311.2 30S ribosomal protein S4e [Aeropyrum pernix K1]